VLHANEAAGVHFAHLSIEPDPPHSVDRVPDEGKI